MLDADDPYGELAQLGERLVCNQEVTGSIPVFSTLSFVGLRTNEGFLTTEYSAIGSFFDHIQRSQVK